VKATTELALLLGQEFSTGVMPGHPGPAFVRPECKLVPGIHVFLGKEQGVDGRDIGERSDAVLRTAMPGHDDAREAWARARPLATTAIAVLLTVLPQLAARRRGALSEAAGGTIFPTNRTGNGSSAGNLRFAA